MNQTVTLPDETLIKFQIWDTAGQERFHSLAPMYYRGAQAAIVVYDITNRNSFEKAKEWIKELQQQGDPNVVVAFVGNKVDMPEARKIQSTEGENYASEHGLFFIETSAKTAENVSELFMKIAKQLPSIQRQKDINPGPYGPKPGSTPTKQQKGGCCG